MPTLVPPRNDADRHAFLQHALTRGQADAVAGKNYLSADTLLALAPITTAFAVAYTGLSDSKSARSLEIYERGEAFSKLQTYVRDLWEGLRRRANRMDEPAQVLTFYGLPLDGSTPRNISTEGWLSFAAVVVVGDAKAVVAGYPAMSNPTAAEVDVVLQQAKVESEEADAADRHFDEQQEALAELRQEADLMAEGVVKELRFTLWRKEVTSQRRIMRTYGVKFSYLEGEPLDLDDQVEDEG